MGRTIILTGANSSAGIYTSEHILKTYPDLIVILLVRNSSPADLNTNSLRKVIAQYPNAKATIEELDLADLNSVRSFARSISASIRNGQYPPLKAIICNAFYWNLVAEPELTNDGFDRTMQVNFVANVALVLPLLESFNSHGGRIVLVSSVAHYRRKNPMTPYIPDIPEYLDELVHPPVDANVQAHGMLRYCNSKLVLTTWCYALNARLEKDPKYRHITAVAVNPGDSQDSRAFRTNTPFLLQVLAAYVMVPLNPLLRRLYDPTWRLSAEAGVDVAKLAVDAAYDKCAKGYFTLLKRDEPDNIVTDAEIQERIWKAAVKWARIGKDICPLTASFE